MAFIPKSARSNSTRYILVALALVALSLVLWRISQVVVVAFGGIVVATLLQAIALPLRRFRRLNHTARIGIAIAVLTLVTCAVGWLFGRQIGGEADELRRLIPAQVSHITARLNTSTYGKMIVNAVHQLEQDSKTIDGGLGVAAVAFLGGTLDAILILFLGIYFALDPELYLEGALRLLPRGHRGRVGRALLDAGTSLRKWLVAQLAAMSVIGILVGVTLAILGVPLAFVLGALAAILEFIPVVGAILFGIPGILVAFSKGPRLAIYTLIAYVVIQQLESNLIVPVIQRWAVEMPPVVSLLAVLIAGILLGPSGVIFAAPLALVTMVLVKHLYMEDVLEHP